MIRRFIIFSERAGLEDISDSTVSEVTESISIIPNLNVAECVKDIHTCFAG